MGFERLVASDEVSIATLSGLAVLRLIAPHLRANPDRAESPQHAVEQGSCLAASEGDEVAGYADFNARLFGQGFVELLVVGPAHRRLGIGMLLLSEAENRCSQKKRLTSCNGSNFSAQFLFEKCDFHRGGQIFNQDDGDPELVHLRAVSSTPASRPA